MQLQVIVSQIDQLPKIRTQDNHFEIYIVKNKNIQLRVTFTNQWGLPITAIWLSVRRLFQTDTDSWRLFHTDNHTDTINHTNNQYPVCYQFLPILYRYFLKEWANFINTDTDID